MREEEFKQRDHKKTLCDMCACVPVLIRQKYLLCAINCHGIANVYLKKDKLSSNAEHNPIRECNLSDLICQFYKEFKWVCVGMCVVRARAHPLAFLCVNQMFLNQIQIECTTKANAIAFNDQVDWDDG